MKKFVILFVLGIVALSYSAQARETSSDTLLNNIQNKIYGAFLASFDRGNTEQLRDIEEKLAAYTPQNFLIKYWYAYAKYYESVYNIKMGEKKMSEKNIKEAIEIMEEIDVESSERYALLAFAQSFSIQFSNGMAAGIVSSKVKKNARKAVELDTTNLRAWYVLASNDYYTPEQYGGKQHTEEYLLKAISLEEQNLENPYMPSWGKKDAYSLLISYYMEKEQMDNARIYVEEALIKYPDNYMINQYAEKIKKN